jgi:hypothetical protein
LSGLGLSEQGEHAGSMMDFVIGGDDYKIKQAETSGSGNSPQ